MSRTPTDEALLAMLCEDTGTHSLDSGGDRDRHHQRNQLRDLESECPSVVTFRHGEIRFEHRVFHWLRERLTWDAEANEAFDGPFLRECDPEGEVGWCELRELFPMWFARWRSRKDVGRSPAMDEAWNADVEEESLYVATGIGGKGSLLIVNTFNHGALLDQTLLFVHFELRCSELRSECLGAYVVLQIHGGCDVRGGYSRPRVFRVEVDAFDHFDFERGAIECTGQDAHRWATDDGYRWERDDSERGERRRLDEYPVMVAEDDGRADATSEGVIVVRDGRARCPLCSGELRARND